MNYNQTPDELLHKDLHIFRMAYLGLSQARQVLRQYGFAFDNNQKQFSPFCSTAIQIIVSMDNQHIKEEIIRSHFFFFVNPNSGNGIGATLLDYAQDPSVVAFSQKHLHAPSLHFVDLNQSNNFSQAFARIENQLSEGGSQVYAIICGGDGTVSWVLNQFSLQSHKASDVIFGIIPIGTGNDLYRSLGWSGSSLPLNASSFLEKIENWTSCGTEIYDIWQVTLRSFQNGQIFRIKNRKEEQMPSNCFSKIFTNYVGIGIDARIVYTMERYRTPWAPVNRILYGLVGIFNLFRPLKPLSHTVQALLDQNQKLIQGSSAGSSEAESTRSSSRPLNNDPRSKVKIKPGYRGLVCLNSTSYMSGVRNIWNASTALATKKNNYNWQPQSHRDGLIEFMAYKNELSLAMERIVPSGAKLAQGEGPFELVMVRPSLPETSFIEIDGESVRVVNLKSISFQRCSSMGGRVRFLVPC